MSLLGTPVYANSATPLWLSTQGDVMTGDITFVSPSSVSWVDASGNTVGRIVGAPSGPAPANTLYIQNNDTIAFGQVGQSSTNTNLYVDAYGGQDMLEVNGQVKSSELGLKLTQSIGSYSIPIGQSNASFTYTTPHLVTPYVFVQNVSAPSAGPALGGGQNSLTVYPQSPTGFTVNLVDASGISVAAVDAPVDFTWIAIDAA